MPATSTMKAMSERAQLRRMTKNEAKEDRGLCNSSNNSNDDSSGDERRRN